MGSDRARVVRSLSNKEAAPNVSFETRTAGRPESPPVAGARRAGPERRGKERRGASNRINRAAPRRSVLRAAGLSATGASSALAAIIFLGGELVLGTTAWVPLGLALTVLGFALLAYMIGCVEQRLIEIRLELMMINGGSRQADRRTGDRRGET